MPELPARGNKGRFDFLNKPIQNPGDPVGARLVPAKKHLKLPKKLIAFLFVLVVLSIVVYLTASYLIPDLVKKKPEAAPIAAKTFEYPLNVAEIKYPSDFLKEKFLENLRLASEEQDRQKSYKLLEEDFVYLLGFYNSTHSYDYRVQLDKFKRYMKVNFTDEYQKNLALYNYACLDKLCPGANDVKKPAEIVYVQENLMKIGSISPVVKDSILRNIDTALLSKDKNGQGNAYILALTSMSLEYRNSKDQAVKDLYLRLNEYVKVNYPDFKVPESVRIEG